jgi:hypothetical protein
MLLKKVCMIGAIGVGKTSLVRKYVHNEFSEKYLTTLGIKIDTKILNLEADTQMKLILWDIEGSNELSTIQKDYLRGADGYITVADVTRKQTVDAVVALQAQVENILGKKPFLFLLNKVDLKHDWEVTKESLLELQARGFLIIQTSAKDGTGIENTFNALGKLLLK